MKKMPLVYRSLAASLLAGGTAFGGTIVPDLDDGDAIFDQTTATANPSNVNPAVVLDSGLTLAASVVPSTLDISNSSTSAVALMEIGGTTSGSGLWLIDGSVWFLSSSGNSTAVPDSSPLDLSGANGAIGARIGALAAGVTTEVFVSFDRINGTLLTSLDSVVASYTVSDVAGWNWGGNRTISFGNADSTDTGGNAGWRGGLADLPGGDPSLFNTNLAVDFDGTLVRGQVFNQVSTIPEPAVPALSLGALALAALRRRRVD